MQTELFCCIICWGVCHLIDIISLNSFGTYNYTITQDLPSWTLLEKPCSCLYSKKQRWTPKVVSFSLVEVEEALTFSRWLSGKESACQSGRHRRWGFDPWVRKIPWRRKWQPTPVYLPGKFYGQRRLVGYSPWSHRVGHYWATAAAVTFSKRPIIVEEHI